MRPPERIRPPTRRELTVALAVLLIAVPIWAPALDLTGPDYRYGVAELSSEEGKLAVDDGYYVVYRDGRPTWLSENPAVERGLEAVSVAAGAGLLLRSRR